MVSGTQLQEPLVGTWMVAVASMTPVHGDECWHQRQWPSPAVCVDVAVMASGVHLHECRGQLQAGT